jgi:diacylglycerol O-acyltransferase / wax synthase
MSERLSPLDASFLYLEEPETAMHVGSVMIFQTPEQGLDFDRLVRHVAARIAFTPRYRQRVRPIPGRLANPVWVDDEHFDIRHHIHRAALPQPGTDDQLAELVARLQAGALERRRPLWELTVVEGLRGGRFAIVTKVHQAMVDGVQAVDLGQVVLDTSPSVPEPPPDTWHPTPEPSQVELLAGAVVDSVRRPGQVLELLRTGVSDVRATVARTADALGGLALAARTATNPPPSSPLNQAISLYRRYAMIATDLENYRRIRNHHLGRPRRRRRTGPARPAATAVPAASSPNGGPPQPTITINDVVLATLAGGLREWLLTRGRTVPPMLRALVPMSVRVDDTREAGAIGGRVASLLVDLPTGEPSAQMRLYQVAYQTKAHRDTGQAVDAPAIAGVAGFGPPTLHSLGARVASGLSRRLFNLVITNVPGPQQPLYLDSARMLVSYPVIPLARGQALSIGLTSSRNASSIR